MIDIHLPQPLILHPDQMGKQKLRKLPAPRSVQHILPQHSLVQIGQMPVNTSLPNLLHDKGFYPQPICLIKLPEPVSVLPYVIVEAGTADIIEIVLI